VASEPTSADGALGVPNARRVLGRWPGARPGSKAGHVVINGRADMLPYGAGALDDRSQLSRAAMVVSRAAKVVFTTADVTAPPAG
jgi:hypothetical protein